MEYCPRFLDYYHKEESYPLTNQSNKSCCGIFLTILMAISLIILIIYQIILYDKNFSVSYSKKYDSTISDNISFGFNILDNSSLNKMDIEITNTFGEKIKSNKCDRFLNIVDDNDDVSHNIYHKCLINYPLSSGNRIPKEEFTLKFDIIIKNNSYIRENIKFILFYKHPVIIHEKEEPLNIGLPTDEFYYFDTAFYTTYQKNIKQIDYITESFNSKKTKSLLYFDEMNEITKIDKSLSLENPNIIGSFKIKLSNHREQYYKKYVISGYIEFLSIIGGYISILNTIFSILSFIFINPNDNLRIFESLRKRNPSILEPSKNVINNFWQNKELNNLDNITNDIKEITCKDKFNYFFLYYFCSCKKNKKEKHLFAIDNYINEQLTIENYLENNICNNQKNKRKIKIFYKW